jgi:hypothetical protein
MITLNEFLRETRESHDGVFREYQKTRPRIVCKNGVSLSVQAGEYLYSTPRTNHASFYATVEVGFPSVRPPEEWEPYFDGEWQEKGFIGTLKRIWSKRKSIFWAIKQVFEGKGLGKRYLKMLLSLKDNATTSVYGYIPITIVEDWIEENGGIDEHKTFEQEAQND